MSPDPNTARPPNPWERFSPETLRCRHGLTSIQVNSVLGRDVVKASREEKLKTLSKAGEFLKISDRFRSADIPFIPLKGPMLSYRLYGDVTARYSNDLDFLVDIKDLEKAGNVLADSGYRMSHFRPSTLKYLHHLQFVDNEGNEAIELHWKLDNDECFNFEDHRELFTGKLSQFVFSGRSFTTLEAEPELFYLVVHGTHHYWGKLKWLVDINKYISTVPIDAGRFHKIVGHFRAERIIAVCNCLLKEYFPGGPLLPGAESDNSRLLAVCRKNIEAAELKNPETIREIIRNISFLVTVYPGFRYKALLAKNVAGTSFSQGRLGKILNINPGRAAL